MCSVLLVSIYCSPLLYFFTWLFCSDIAIDFCLTLGVNLDMLILMFLFDLPIGCYSYFIIDYSKLFLPNILSTMNVIAN